MGLSRMMELVSQADREGISLGALISREMTEDEMDAAQEELTMAIEANYLSIGSFMEGVEVASLEEIMARQDIAASSLDKNLSDELCTED